MVELIYLAADFRFAYTCRLHGRRFFLAPAIETLSKVFQSSVLKMF